MDEPTKQDYEVVLSACASKIRSLERRIEALNKQVSTLSQEK